MNAKKAVLAVVVVFLGFWMFTDPSGLAERRQGAPGQTWELAEQLFRPSSASSAPWSEPGRVVWWTTRHPPAPAARRGRGHRRRGPPPLGRRTSCPLLESVLAVLLLGAPRSCPSTCRGAAAAGARRCRPRRLGLPARAPRPVRDHQHAGVPGPRGAVAAGWPRCRCPGSSTSRCTSRSSAGCSATATSSSSRPPRSRGCATSASSAGPTSATSPSSGSCSARACAARGWSTTSAVHGAAAVRPDRRGGPAVGTAAGPASPRCTPSRR